MPSNIKTPKYKYQITKGGSFYSEQEIKMYYPNPGDAETIIKHSEENYE